MKALKIFLLIGAMSLIFFSCEEENEAFIQSPKDQINPLFSEKIEQLGKRLDLDLKANANATKENSMVFSNFSEMEDYFVKYKRDIEAWKEKSKNRLTESSSAFLTPSGSICDDPSGNATFRKSTPIVGMSDTRMNFSVVARQGKVTGVGASLTGDNVAGPPTINFYYLHGIDLLFIPKLDEDGYPTVAVKPIEIYITSEVRRNVFGGGGGVAVERRDFLLTVSCNGIVKVTQDIP